MESLRAIQTVLPSQFKHWVGNGFHVQPLFGSLAFTNEISPFLMLDYASPKEFSPTTSRRGVGQHPHKGFETVTIAFQGEVEHADSTGKSGIIGTGDVQWMTAGSGIVHEEFHSTNFAKNGGIFEMMQLWVNLPSKLKLTPPKYQAISSAQIPSIPISNNGGQIRIIAGNYQNKNGPASTFTPMNIYDILLNKDSQLHLELEEEFNTMCVIRNGLLRHISSTNETVIPPSQVVLFERKGNSVLFEALEETKFLVLSGKPIDEPIAARGPFVMNTQAELMEAFTDFQTGRFGL
jgi:hypothetical protein